MLDGRYFGTGSEGRGCYGCGAVAERGGKPNLSPPARPAGPLPSPVEGEGVKIEQTGVIGVNHDYTDILTCKSVIFKGCFQLCN